MADVRTSPPAPSLRQRKRENGSAPAGAAAEDAQGKQTRALGFVDEVLGELPNVFLASVALAPVGVSVLLAMIARREIVTLVLASTAFSVLAFLAARTIIPLAGAKLIGKLSGVDLGKLPREPAIPQGLGLVSGTCFLVVLILTQTFVPLLVSPLNGAMMSEKYEGIMLSVCFSVLLGLADDIMDIRWAHKLVVGLLASLPLMTSYDGPTSILLPSFLQPIVLSQPVQFLLTLLRCSSSPDGIVLELGVFYLVYVVALIVFCTNAINIYAGINGLEVGQSLVIACGVAAIDAWELASSAPGSGHFVNHLFSLTVMLPFIATSLGLLVHNWYPARVFIGDVFPYYAGMTFAATAVLGHYSRSLLLLLVPQVLNYVYSMPQLFGLVPCPRHRLPAVNPDTKLLEPSRVAPGDERANMTLICLALRVLGPMRERTLTLVLLVFQGLCTLCFGWVGRMVLSKALFP